MWAGVPARPSRGAHGHGGLCLTALIRERMRPLVRGLPRAGAGVVNAPSTQSIAGAALSWRPLCCGVVGSENVHSCSLAGPKFIQYYRQNTKMWCGGQG